MCASRRKACRPGRRPSARKPSCFSSSSSREARCILARWRNNETPRGAVAPEKVHLLAPFDPVVHDRTRFELLWRWTYRFEAYTPARKRKLGYYALPLLWRERVIGWANLAVKNGALCADVGYVAGEPPKDLAFQGELEAELSRMQFFLGNIK